MTTNRLTDAALAGLELSCAARAAGGNSFIDLSLDDVLSLIAELTELRAALRFYADEAHYSVTCATEGGVPTEVPHLLIEEDGGAVARKALFAASPVEGGEA